VFSSTGPFGLSEVWGQTRGTLAALRLVFSMALGRLIFNEKSGFGACLYCPGRYG
jgi:hypothetical protein